MIKIIALEREYGSGASVIAEQLATRLGWTLLDQSLTDEIARLANVTRTEAQHCDENLDPLLYRGERSSGTEVLKPSCRSRNSMPSMLTAPWN